MSSFDERTRWLERHIGSGELTGEVTFDTPYALVQHERTDFYHPMGGQAKYLESVVKERYTRYLAAIANDALGIGPEQSMVLVTEDLLGESVRRAPVREGTLRASGFARVY